MATTQKVITDGTVSAGGTITSFSNTPQAGADTFTEDNVTVKSDGTTIVLDVMANDGGGTAKSLYSIDTDGSASTGTKVLAPVDLLHKDVVAGTSGWETMGTEGARIRITDGKVELDVSTYLQNHFGTAYTSVASLNEGQFVNLDFTYAIQLGNGTLSWATATIRIEGTNDGPKLSAVTAGSIAEVDQSSTTVDNGLTGTLSATDVDVVDSKTFGIVGGTDNGNGTVSLVGDYGTLTVDKATGAYSYLKSSTAIEALDDGDLKHDSFTVSVTDSHNATDTQSFKVNITGADDAPTLAAVTSGAITELNQSSSTNDAGLSGTLSGHDVDTDDTVTYGISGGTTHDDGTVSLAGDYGTLVVDTATGAYHFDKNASAVEALHQGQIDSDVFTVTATDGDGPLVTQTYTVNVTGANDAPVLDAITAGSIAEDDQSSTTTDASLSGTLSATDIDNDASSAFGIVGGTSHPDGTVTLAGNYGTLTVDTMTGAYSYAKDPAAIEALDQGDGEHDDFTITATDSHGAGDSKVFTVNITGADDAPTLAAVTSGSITEVDQSTSTIDSGLTGILSGQDVDSDDTVTYGISGGTSHPDGTVSLAGDFGTLVVDTVTGAYHFDKNAAAIEALNQGQTDSDVFTVTATDGDGPLVTQTYTVNINGANEAVATPTDTGKPTDIAFAPVQSGNSDNPLGHFVAVDPDSADTITWSLVDDFSGSKKATIDAATGNLNVGAADAGTHVLHVTATDADAPNGHTTTIEFNLVIGSNQGNTITAGATNNNIESGEGGADKITGSAGVDYIIGGSADDKITGLGGPDVLVGGDGNDVFVFTLASDSPLGAGDTILGYIGGNTGSSDTIDLSAFNITANEVTVAVSAGNTVIHADVNGSGFGAGDLEITLVGVSLTESQINFDYTP